MSLQRNIIRCGEPLRWNIVRCGISIQWNIIECGVSTQWNATQQEKDARTVSMNLKSTADERSQTQAHLSDSKCMKFHKRQVTNTIVTENMSAVAWEQSVWDGDLGRDN